MPMASAAISSSRTARKARPSEERTRRQEISMVIPLKKYTQKKLLQEGIPLKPRAPPTLSMFRISTRMISPNPRVTMAR